MVRISFLNGKFLAHDQAFVHIEDRGFQLADGIYEVILFCNNKLIDVDGHLSRLRASATAIELQFNQSAKELKTTFLELFRKNNLKDGSVYLQITRGVSPRNQAFPPEYTATIIATVSPLKKVDKKDLENGFSAITHADIRWARCNIKSIALLSSTLIKQKASASNAIEAILIKDGYVTECSFSNVFIVDASNRLITRNADNNILCGITRNRIISLAKMNDIEVVEKKFSQEELLAAQEVFITSSTLLIRPISKIDGQIIGHGKAGSITKKLTKLYNDWILYQIPSLM